LTIRQNLFWAFVYNGRSAAMGRSRSCSADADPMYAAAAMALSSAGARGNSLRLGRVRLD
jgi:cation transport ATPase